MVGTYYFLELTSKKNHHRLFFSKTQPFGHRAEGGMPLPPLELLSYSSVTYLPTNPPAFHVAKREVASLL